MYAYADNGLSGRGVGVMTLEEDTSLEVVRGVTVDGTTVADGTMMVDVALTETTDAAFEPNENDAIAVLADELLVNVGVDKVLPLDTVVDEPAAEAVVLEMITVPVALELVAVIAVLVEAITVDVELDATTAELDVLDSVITLTELLGKLVSYWYIIILLDPPQYWLLLPLHGKLQRLEFTSVDVGFRVKPQLHSCAYSSPKYV
jgi:hypothetical protein